MVVEGGSLVGLLFLGGEIQCAPSGLLPIKGGYHLLSISEVMRNDIL